MGAWLSRNFPIDINIYATETGMNYHMQYFYRAMNEINVCLLRNVRSTEWSMNN